MLFDFGLIASALRLATPLAYVALGALICERAGVINVGVEGLMLMGALAANVVTALTSSFVLGVLAGILAGMIFGLMLAYLTVFIKADQLVVGIGFNIFGLGLSSFCREVIFGVQSGPNASRTEPFPVFDGSWIGSVPVVGPILVSQTILSLGVLIAPLAIGFVLWRTGPGLAARVVGENARMADMLGINVTRTRILAVIIGSGFAGLGGADLALAEVNYFITNMTAGRGYIALAAVVLGRWNPYATLMICLVLGVADASQFRFQTLQLAVPPQLWVSMPYIVALILLLCSRGQAIAPAEDGKPYTRN
jgi:general nucleoside transport system permease protein